MAGSSLFCGFTAAAGPSLDDTLQLDVSTGQVVQRWDFGREDDRDFDAWPDDWQRRSGRDYPSYIDIEIRSDETALEAQAQQADTRLMPIWVRMRQMLAKTPHWLPGVPTYWTRLSQAVAGSLPGLPPSLKDMVSSHYVEIRMDGGAAMLQSPPFPVTGMYSYVLGARLRTAGLERDAANAELVFLDQDGKVLETVPTPVVRQTTPWTMVHTPATAPPPNCSSAVVRLRVEPGSEGADIRGTADFDMLRLRQFPQLRLQGSLTNGLYQIDEPIEVTAEAMGLRFKAAEVRFSLLNAFGKPIKEQLRTVETHADTDTDGEQAIAFGGQAKWQLPSLPPGFYQLTAQLIAADRSAMTTGITFAVIDHLPSGGGGFGWTLPAGAPRGDLRSLPSWLRDCHVGWLKYPCWVEPEDIAAADELAWLMSRVQDSGIEVVGLLDQPPAGVAPEIDSRKQVAAINVFREPDVWQPLLESLMNRLTMKIRWWQLGRERDFSFLARGGLKDSISEINLGLQGYGQPLNLVISWPWLEPQPDARSWKAVIRSDATTLAAEELDAYLTAEAEATPADSDPSTQTWLLLDPLPAGQYDTVTRIRDLVLRMATVRGHNVQAAFASDPLNPQTGLLRSDGTPDIMLLPWRTTAAMIGSLKRTGSLRLPGGSSNMVLSNGEQTVMVLWNSAPTTEQVYLGEKVEIVDVWGNRTAAETVEVDGMTKHQIEATDMPVFVTGLHPLMTQFRMAVKLDRQSIDSLLGRSQTIAVQMDNPAGQAISGDVLMLVNDAWNVPRYLTQWQIPAGAKREQPIPITLSSNATTGLQEIGLQFSLDRAGNKKFMVYRELRVGPEGLEVIITTRMDESGNLVVRLEMENSTEASQRYDCSIFPPGRQYQRQTLSVAAGERTRREFVLPNGQRLLGKTLLLRATEQDGRRVLNYTVSGNR